MPSNTLDGDLDTRWSAEGAGQFIQYDLGEIKQIEEIGMAFYEGDERVQEFKIRTSEDKEDWQTQVDGKSSGDTNQEQLFEVNAQAR